MLDSDLEALYKANIGISHYAALRAVWDSGYNYGSSQSPAGQGVDPSELANATAAATDETDVNTDPNSTSDQP
jgi:hypothetical protein